MAAARAVMGVVKCISSNYKPVREKRVLTKTLLMHTIVI